jgi:hypothetical protein
VSFFFGFLKEKLRGIAVTDEGDMISRAQALFDETQESIMTLVYDLNEASWWSHQEQRWILLQMRNNNCLLTKGKQFYRIS